jgi:hypothetical protein
LSFDIGQWSVRDTPPYGHAPTYQISLTYLERQKRYEPDKKILFKKQLFDLEVKGQGPKKVITVRDTLPYGPNGTKLGSKHLCKVLYTVSPFRSVPPTNMAAKGNSCF